MEARQNEQRTRDDMLLEERELLEIAQGSEGEVGEEQDMLGPDQRA